jgi:hypothetical protein
MRFTNVHGNPVSINVKRWFSRGWLERCPSCDGLSAYAWEDTEIDPNTVLWKTEAKDRNKIAHIPAASGFEWTCGHCGLSWTPKNSPINSPCYTHSED